MKKKSLSAKKKIHKNLLKNLNNQKINRVFREFTNYLDFNVDKKFLKFGVAVSGGPDSLALAFLTKCYLLRNKLISAKFFIVDHNLRRESAKEAKLVKQFLKKFDINCEILKWRGKKPHSNIQRIARDNRYNLLKKSCKKNNICHLLIGHHIDDLYENFFIRLSRGSGLRGLSSFGEPIGVGNNITILRPLMKFEKKELIYISKRVFNFFVEDPSNLNENFKRIRIRKLIKALELDGLDKKKLMLTINNLKESNRTINHYVKNNIKQHSVLLKNENICFLSKNFFEQPNEIIFRSLSDLMRKVGKRYYSARGKSIVDVILKIKSRKLNKTTLGGCLIEKVNETVLISREKTLKG